jgi:hypothetical protein
MVFLFRLSFSGDSNPIEAKTQVETPFAKSGSLCLNLFQDNFVIDQAQFPDARPDHLALAKDILQHQTILIRQHAVHILHKEFISVILAQISMRFTHRLHPHSFCRYSAGATPL